MSQTKAQLIDGQGEINLGGLDIDASAPDGSVNLDSSGRLLVGTSSSRVIGNAGNYGSSIQVESTTYATLSLTQNSNDSIGSILAIGKSRGGIGSNTIVQNGDTIGDIRFAAADGSSLTSQCASITVKIDGTPSAGDVPGRLEFSTTADGAASPTERVRILSTGDFECDRIYSNTTANAANVNVGATGQLNRSTSSIKYKTNVETLQDKYADAILNVRSVWYRSLCENDNPAYGWWGFIAEEVAEIDPRLVQWKTKEIAYGEDGDVTHVPCDPEPEGVAYDRFVPHLLNLIKRQKEQIEAMEARLSALEGA